VTGAGRGIGRGCAIALAEAGAAVMLMARSRSELEETACELRAMGRNVQSIVCDVTDSRQVKEAVDFLEQIDILVNNAGTNVPEPFLEVSEENLDRVLAVNVKGVFLVAQAAARRMVERGEGGSIINISSQMGHVGAPRRTVYCATKHAVEGLTKAMAVELAPHNVRVDSVAPTFVETPMTKPFLEDKTFREDTLSRIPLGRLGQVEDVTGAVVFLASPAAGLITGASLLVDGGWTAQ
jgi:NAD(P)-dependent dehydrogenase (short-subunit alcohol dehydrogenase family)